MQYFGIAGGTDAKDRSETVRASLVGCAVEDAADLDERPELRAAIGTRNLSEVVERFLRTVRSDLEERSQPPRAPLRRRAVKAALIGGKAGRRIGSVGVVEAENRLVTRCSGRSSVAPSEGAAGSGDELNARAQPASAKQKPRAINRIVQASKAHRYDAVRPAAFLRG